MSTIFALHNIWVPHVSILRRGCFIGDYLAGFSKTSSEPLRTASAFLMPAWATHFRLWFRRTHIPALWLFAFDLTLWIVGVLWMVRASDLVRHLPEIPDLTSPDWDLGPAQTPSLAVIVPARDEEASLRATLDSLTQQEYPRLEIIVVDDRSVDATGSIADEFAAHFPEKVRALHLRDLPEGWLGKTWALEAGTLEARAADYLLFTDADVVFSPSILWRALAYAQASEADHLVIFPTPIVTTWGEGVVLGFCQILGLWVARPWRVADPHAKQDVIGIGAFNLVRRDALEELGGWLPQRMVVLEDVTLGRRMKVAGMRTRVAFAPGQVLVHWARGFGGVVRAMTKNLFSSVNFRVPLMLLACVWIVLFCLAPLAGLFWWRTTLPCLLMLLAIIVSYREFAGLTFIRARYGWGFPLGALALIFAMLRSMASVLVRRGVLWRGTHYPLRELRRYNNPLQWQREATEQRYRERKTQPTKLRRWVDRLKQQRRR